MFFNKQNKINYTKGFTLIELMIVVAIIGTLSAIAVPNMIGFINKAKVVKTVTELKTIESALMEHYNANKKFPQSLDEIGLGNLKDMWGNPYVYNPVEGSKKGKLRKNKYLVPVNTDFDLYSCGKDGKTVAPFTAKASRDDIVRANNGGFFGLVEDY
jgi:general secretion pathway protein G